MIDFQLLEFIINLWDDIVNSIYFYTLLRITVDNNILIE
jgi:hypothetical protein